jgi:hypothetical protein
MPEMALPDMPADVSWMEPVYKYEPSFDPEETSQVVEDDMQSKLGRKEFAAAFKLPRKKAAPNLADDPSLQPPKEWHEGDLEKKLVDIMGDDDFKSAIDSNEGVTYTSMPSF